MDTCSANGQRHTTNLNYKISTTWKTKPRTTPQKTSTLLMGLGLELVTKPKPLQTI